jgi:tetratricopeptide (TPR) repeat protein
MDPHFSQHRAARLTDAAYDDVENGDFPAARRKLEEALRLDDDSHCAHSEYAFVLSVFDERQRARSHILKAIALAPREPKYWAALSKWHLDNGELEAALRSILVAEALDATFPTVLVAKMHILQAAGFSRQALEELANEAREFYRNRATRADGTPLKLGDVDAFVSRVASGHHARRGGGSLLWGWLRRLLGE